MTMLLTETVPKGGEREAQPEQNEQHPVDRLGDEPANQAG
jgi:hypothetical protein